jgi:hypothetical protein
MRTIVRGYLRIFVTLLGVVLPLTLTVGALYLLVAVLVAALNDVTAFETVAFALVRGIVAALALELGLGVLLTCVVLVRDVVRWMIDRTPPPLALGLSGDDDDQGGGGGFLRSIEEFVLFYIRGAGPDGLDAPDGSSRWSRLTLMVSVMLAGLYGIFVILLSGEVALMRVLSDLGSDELRTLARESGSVAAALEPKLAGTYFVLALAFVVSTLGGIMVVPRRHTSEYQGAILTYVLLGTFWFALLYQSGSASGILHFAIRDIDADRVGVLTFFDALYFAVGTSVTAGGDGITPADGITRSVTLLQFGLLGLVIYWLFQRVRLST